MALGFLETLGIKSPSQKQINIVEKLLSTLTIECKILPHELLTPKEYQCLLLAAKGLTVKETAEIMRVKESTIMTHRDSLKKKLNCKTIAQAVLKGIRIDYLTRLNERFIEIS